jgi:hypothetical protein
MQGRRIQGGGAPGAPSPFIIACVSFSELEVENDTLNQAELNEIKINENN